MDNKIVMIIIALFIPPLAVYMHEGNKITKNFWITLVLWFLLFGIGGIIYALYIILK